MKKYILFLLLTTLPFSLFAQETNDVFSNPQLAETNKPSPKLRKWNPSPHTSKQAIARKKEIEKKYRLLDQTLSEIGVNAEDRIKIRTLQKKHQKKIRINTQKTIQARKNLSMVQNKGGDADAIEQAILHLSEAQTDQIRILVNNRMAMEQILGKKKYTLFMKSAREQFRKHRPRRNEDLPSRTNKHHEQSRKPLAK